MGLASSMQEAMNQPRCSQVASVSEPQDYKTVTGRTFGRKINIIARIMSMGTLHNRLQ
jgi:2-methylaconitate cis-trans-isomerase PrpF